MAINMRRGHGTMRTFDIWRWFRRSTGRHSRLQDRLPLWEQWLLQVHGAVRA